MPSGSRGVRLHGGKSILGGKIREEGTSGNKLSTSVFRSTLGLFQYRN